MSIKGLWTFRHLKGMAAASASAYGPQYIGAPLNFVANTGSGGLNSSGWLVIYNGTNYTGYYTANLNSIYSFTGTRMFCGLRYRRTTAANAARAMYVISLKIDASNTFVVVTEADFNVEIGREYYVEVEYTPATRAMRVWVDDVYVKTVTVPVNVFVAAGQFYFGYGNPTIGNGTQEFNDFYLVEDDGTGTVNDRLGPVQPFETPIVSATGAGWTTTNGGSLLSVINTALTANPGSPPATVPAAQITATDAPLTLTLGKPPIPNRRSAIVAVSLKASIAKTVNDGSVLHTSVSQAGTAAEVMAVPLQTTMQFTADVGKPAKTPGAQLWDISKVEGAQVIFTPKIG